jgi:hypothetical protein
MPIKQQDIDKKMIADYKTISRQIKDNTVRLRCLRDIAHKWNGQFKGSIHYLIGLDFTHLLDSIDYIQKSCNSLYSSSTGVGNHFIPYTTFYREILSIMKQIMMRLHYFEKENIQFNNEDSIKYNSLNVFLESEYQWRNRSEHGIDPFYGDYEKVLRVANINKMISFMEMVVDLMNNLDRSFVDENSVVAFNPDYNELSLKQRKELLHKNNETFLSIVTKITELSHMVMQKQQDEELKILLNLVMKCGEISRFIQYTYSMGSDQNDTRERAYAYFARLGLTFCYQFYDKLGLYIKQRYSLPTKTTYFKENVRIIKDTMNFLQLDAIVMRCIIMEESNEYCVLNAIRQAICHKNKWVDYKASSELISSLIVRLFTNMTELINLIINDYFKEHQLQVSPKAIEEALQRSKYIKL